MTPPGGLLVTGAQRSESCIEVDVVMTSAVGGTRSGWDQRGEQPVVIGPT